MKVWILVLFFTLGALTCHVLGDEGSGSGDNDDYFDVEHGDEEIDEEYHNRQYGNTESGDEESDNEEAEDEYEYEYECDHFNLEICMHDYENFADFDAPESNDPLCWESYTTMQCLRDYARQCFPESKVKEDYLCKIAYFQDRIQLLCLNETEGYDEDKAVEEALKCLESAETDAQECVELAVPEIANMVKEKNIKPGEIDIQDLKCMILHQVMECTTDRLKQRCDEEVVEAFNEGAQEALEELLGGSCKGKDYSNVAALTE